ncbi:hypothetical protein H6F76_10825 [Leptolyngbya sp. FACHB-321]|uniref:hypothetical protein n=1 Tax=Leptolyngbya sp. FACHB-321 TaxID=2692807 RepID=UPI001684EE61|nr:hypothetical protein [Leptolyngbya sp. FACHB-321]MBD2035511.1 hypothetical protein [Leptolyngbya sp. FACHB-321]
MVELFPQNDKAEDSTECSSGEETEQMQPETQQPPQQDSSNEELTPPSSDSPAADLSDSPESAVDSTSSEDSSNIITRAKPKRPRRGIQNWGEFMNSNW